MPLHPVRASLSSLALLFKREFARGPIVLNREHIYFSRGIVIFPPAMTFPGFLPVFRGGRTDVVASCAVFGFRSSSSPFQNDTGKPMQHLTSAFLSLGWVGCGREEPPCNVFDSIAVIIIMANSSIAETRRSVPTCPEYGPRQGRVPVSMINRSIFVK